MIWRATACWNKSRTYYSPFWTTMNSNVIIILILINNTNYIMKHNMSIFKRTSYMLKNTMHANIWGGGLGKSQYYNPMVDSITDSSCKKELMNYSTVVLMDDIIIYFCHIFWSFPHHPEWSWCPVYKWTCDS